MAGLRLLLWVAALISAGHAQPGMDKVGHKDTQCHVCSAVVNETVKKLQPMLNAGTRYPVSKALEDLCGQPNFQIYNFAPPTMVKACETLMDNHDASDVLENVLTKAVKLAKKAGSKQLDREALERRVCYELTEVCVGANLQPEPGAPQVMVDGKPHDPTNHEL